MARLTEDTYRQANQTSQSYLEHIGVLEKTPLSSEEKRAIRFVNGLSRENISETFLEVDRIYSVLQDPEHKEIGLNSGDYRSIEGLKKKGVNLHDDQSVHNFYTMCALALNGEDTSITKFIQIRKGVVQDCLPLIPRESVLSDSQLQADISYVVTELEQYLQAWSRSMYPLLNDSTPTVVRIADYYVQLALVDRSAHMGVAKNILETRGEETYPFPFGNEKISVNEKSDTDNLLNNSRWIKLTLTPTINQRIEIDTTNTLNSFYIFSHTTLPDSIEGWTEEYQSEPRFRDRIRRDIFSKEYMFSERGRKLLQEMEEELYIPESRIKSELIPAIEANDIRVAYPAQLKWELNRAKGYLERTNRDVVARVRIGEESFKVEFVTYRHMHPCWETEPEIMISGAFLEFNPKTYSLGDWQQFEQNKEIWKQVPGAITRQLNTAFKHNFIQGVDIDLTDAIADAKSALTELGNSMNVARQLGRAPETEKLELSEATSDQSDQQPQQ